MLAQLEDPKFAWTLGIMIIIQLSIIMNRLTVSGIGLVVLADCGVLEGRVEGPVACCTDCNVDCKQFT